MPSPRRRTRTVALLALAALTAGTATATGQSLNAAAKRGRWAAVTWLDDTAVPDYTPDTASLNKHKAPQWFSDAKFGTFITWGAYSVPAYAPKDAAQGNRYAEWYWSELNRKDSPTQKRHKEKYGTNVAYDDFLKQWKAEKWNPDEWLKLFKEAGSKYYVLVAKHHDGVALWDSAVSDRDTTSYGPMRDIAKELVDANNKGGYGLKNGMYFSMPEWLGPDTPKQWGGWFGSGAPKNPYTGEPVPYTGYKPVADWVKDYQYPQMNELVDRFDPDLFWCDIGGVNNSDQFMARYYNQAKNRANPKDVAVDNRCGNQHADFTTPEYSTEPDIKKSAWEASRGIGHSYGYNAEEDINDYLTDKDLVTSFIDTVSKGGNLLLDVGPKADGTIPDLQAQRLRGIGAWLKINGEAVYGSGYWTQAEDKGANVPVRFTKQPKALYATATAWPGTQLTLTAPVDVGSGDEVRLLGYDKPLSTYRDGSGRLVITMPAAGQAATPSKNAWTFRIAPKGYSAATADLLDVGVSAPPSRSGTSVKATVTLANRGDRATLAGTATVTPSWAGAQQVTVTVPALKPHQRMHATLDLALPAGTSPGTEQITAKVGTRGQSYTGRGELRVIGASVPVDLGAIRDADVIADASAPADTDFAGKGIGYPAEELPKPGPYTSDLVRYEWPSGAPGVKNAVKAGDDRKVTVPRGSYGALDLLASTGYGPGDLPVVLHYADGSTQEVKASVPDWVTGGGTPALTSPYRWLNGKRQDLKVSVYGVRVPVDPGKELTALTLRKASGPQGPQATSYVFAATLEK
ncbi:alpha-L-fucosidase [Streptomyces finlayi]|uniref:alpha-L-fucosidase n=1 Tax=Streptomyces finlayi TaxID=67296 RepID=UPI0016727816|nr:alpha-L-fucosidase [Streptomyces finlayi]